ncbi:ABC transporter ATP-binding protein [Bacillus changyiensis]|uniref:ABC transporter ATP-binding protein n=1 Tax=Bacillus changyiensis TaxID=3004103 RepID=UPI0022E65DD3|nr:ABC transporter ATP-binding protein [Bacillus changyiensis]MDA1477712.1 ABC transporter ATP-binding protein [Bacillus changyiensis]
MSFLKVQNITHTYFTLQEKTTALTNVQFDVKKGEFVSLIGPSGCGKTTLLSIIAGIISPTEGHVLIENSQKDRQIGYMLQQDYLFPWKTIEENLLLGLRITKQLNNKTKQAAFDLLAKLGLQQIENKYPHELSGGMRQRAALARTLAVDPDILLLDEPFSALDYQTKLNLEDLVFNTLNSFQKTAILVTHDIEEAIAMSSRIFLFSKQPGTIYKTFIVPKTLQSLTPFKARQHPEFQTLFQNIWKELNHLEHHQTE